MGYRAAWDIAPRGRACRAGQSSPVRSASWRCRGSDCYHARTFSVHLARRSKLHGRVRAGHLLGERRSRHMRGDAPRHDGERSVSIGKQLRHYGEQGPWVGESRHQAVREDHRLVGDRQRQKKVGGSGPVKLVLYPQLCRVVQAHLYSTVLRAYPRINRTESNPAHACEICARPPTPIVANSLDISMSLSGAATPKSMTNLWAHNQTRAPAAETQCVRAREAPAERLGELVHLGLATQVTSFCNRSRLEAPSIRPSLGPEPVAWPV